MRMVIGAMRRARWRDRRGKGGLGLEQSLAGAPAADGVSGCGCPAQTRMQTGTKTCKQHAREREGARGRRRVARGGRDSPESAMKIARCCGDRRWNSMASGRLGCQKM
jgi:hypothetical protein